MMRRPGVRAIPPRRGLVGPAGNFDAQPKPVVFEWVLEYWEQWTKRVWVGYSGGGYNDVGQESDRREITVYASTLEQARAKLNTAVPFDSAHTRHSRIISVQEVLQ